MESCETFEMAIEERRLGTLGAEAVRRLEEHITGCAACRQFADFVRHSEESMSSADATLNDTDWVWIKKTLRRATNVARDQLLLWLIAFLAATPLIAQAVGTDVPFTVMVMLVLVPLAVLARHALARRLIREMEWVGNRDRDFFDQYRTLVDRQMRMLWRSILIFPAWALIIGGVGWYLAGRGDLLTVLCRALLLVVTVLLSVWLHRVPLARLRQIRAQLS